MELHHKFPEKIMKEITLWYDTTLILISMCMITLAGIQCYTMYAIASIKKQHSNQPITHKNQNFQKSIRQNWEIARIFADICNTMAPSVHLSKLIIDLSGTISLQGTIYHDKNALADLLALCKRSGFPQTNTLKTTQVEPNIMTFEITASAKNFNDRHNQYGEEILK